MKTAHLSDDRLVELYFTETPSAQEQQHLGHCMACDRRRSELAHLLDETGQAAAEDLEVAFPAERLARQQLQILERVDLAGGPARVIAFPAAPPQAPVVRRSGSPSRWVAAAAVAGLLVGVVAGRAGRESGVSPSPALLTASEQRQGAVRPVSSVSAPLSADDQFLVELEQVIDGGGGALHALDQLTPRAWDR